MERDNKEMSYQEVCDTLSELGWVKDKELRYATIYRPNNGKKSKYRLYQSGLNVGIYNLDNLDIGLYRFCEPFKSCNELFTYTKLVNKILDAEHNQKKVTLFDYRKRVEAYTKFTKDRLKRWESYYKENAFGEKYERYNIKTKEL